MPIVGDGSLYQIKDFQLRGSDQFLNVYHYYLDVPPDTIDAIDIAGAWHALFALQIPQLQPPVITHTTLVVDELTSNQNFVEIPALTGAGTLVGVELASYQAASFRLLRTTKETRSGWKRMAAGTEDVIGGNAWSIPFIAELEEFAGVLGAFLDLGVNRPYPVIVGKTYTGDPPVLNPPNQWLYNPISAVEAVTIVTTQNTRKRGRGA